MELLNLPALLKTTNTLPKAIIKCVGALIDIDLSDENPDLNHQQPSLYIEEICSQFQNTGIGGYLEHRKIYEVHDTHTQKEIRNIHIGIDIWQKALTAVYAPIDGIIHSFKDNNIKGDYGPCVILQHKIKTTSFYTLYGHLSRMSLLGLVVGDNLKAGEQFALLGNCEENGNWPPHLHFQIIKDLEGYSGDYPGVSSEEKLDYYRSNCPDPSILIRF